MIAMTREHARLARLFGFAIAASAALQILTHGGLLTPANLESMAFQFPELGLLSFAMMIAMLTGGIDLSIVSVANLAGITAAIVMTYAAGSNPSGTGIIVLGTAAALATGLVCGAVNGALIAVVGVSPILATLGTMQLFFGAAVVWTRGQAVVGLPDALQNVGNGTALGLPVPLLLFALGGIVTATLSSLTVFGVESRLLGSNLTASRFSGIGVRSVLVRTYVLSAAIASVTGVLMVAHANSAKADYGTSYLLQSILVVVLGGVNPAGGAGRVLGVSAAVLSLQLLSSAFGILHLSSFAKELAWGGFLLLVMVANWWFDEER